MARACAAECCESSSSTPGAEGGEGPVCVRRGAAALAHRLGGRGGGATPPGVTLLYGVPVRWSVRCVGVKCGVVQNVQTRVGVRLALLGPAVGGRASLRLTGGSAKPAVACLAPCGKTVFPALVARGPARPHGPTPTRALAVRHRVSDCEER